MKSIRTISAAVVNRHASLLIGLLLLALLCTSDHLAAQGYASKGRTLTIGYIGKNKSNPVFQAAFSGVRVAARDLGPKYGVTITVENASPESDNAVQQAGAIAEFVRKGVSGIVISSTDQTIVGPAIDDAFAKGIPVVCFDSDAPKSKRMAYHGPDDLEFGRLLMQGLAASLNNSGTIAVLAGNAKSLNLQRRLKGLRDELRRHPKISLPDGFVFNNPDDPAASSDIIRKTQLANPRINGWAFIGSWPLQIKKSLPWQPGEVKAAAGNAVPAELAYVESGHVQSLVGVNCFQMGHRSVELLLDKIIRNSTPADPIQFAPLTPVTSVNVKEWLYNWRVWLLKEALN